MIAPKYSSAPGKLPVLFLLLEGIPLAALGWLGWRLLEQERALDDQRLRERLANAARLLAHEVDQRLTAWEELLPQAAQGSPVVLPAGAVLLVVNGRGVVRQQGARLSYYPSLAPAPEIPAHVFARAEAREFAGDDMDGATAMYRDLARTGDRPQLDPQHGDQPGRQDPLLHPGVVAARSVGAGELPAAGVREIAGPVIVRGAGRRDVSRFPPSRASRVEM